MLKTYGSLITTFHRLAHICKAFKLVKANISHSLIQFFLKQEEDDIASPLDSNNNDLSFKLTCVIILGQMCMT
jgi:hypothetical protein